MRFGRGPVKIKPAMKLAYQAYVARGLNRDQGKPDMSRGGEIDKETQYGDLFTQTLFSGSDICRDDRP